MVAQKTLLILTCIVGAYLLAVLIILGVLPHVQYTSMLNETQEVMQTYADHMTGVCNYLMRACESIVHYLM